MPPSVLLLLSNSLSFINLKWVSPKRDAFVSLLDSILGQVSESATVQNLAAKVGLTPKQVEEAVGALSQAHVAEGDTVTAAAEETGLPANILNEIVDHIGGEGSLGKFASILESEGGLTGMLGGLKKLF